jgi:peptidoglycan/LPS O-acetylase OafA/YrhL
MAKHCKTTCVSAFYSWFCFNQRLKLKVMPFVTRVNMSHFQAIRFESLTGLRGILATLVVVAHGVNRVGWFETYPQVFPTFTAFGHFGVVGFFILSGFILKSVYNGRDWTFREFAVNRFARIYPLYLACLVFTLPIDWFTPGFPPEGRVEALALSLVLQQSWFEFSNGRFNGPGWTLGVEIFFYSVFPLLFILNKRRPKLFLMLFFGLLGVTATFWDPSNFQFAHRVPHMRLWEFVLGVIAADTFLKLRQWKIKIINPTALAAVTLFFGILGGSQIHSWVDWPFAEWLMMAACALALILLLGLADLSATKPAFLATPICVLAGELSYGVYLVHDGIQRYGKVGIEWITGASMETFPFFLNILFIGFTVLASFASAYVLWRYLERPTRDYLRGKLSTSTNSSEELANKLR